MRDQKQRECAYVTCRVTFVPRARGGKPQLYCSQACRRRRAPEVAAWAGNRTPEECAYPTCDVMFTPGPHGGKKQIYCSRKCGQRRPPRMPRVCSARGCDIEFIPPGNTDQVYCSSICREESPRESQCARDGCNETFERHRTSVRKYCSAECRYPKRECAVGECNRKAEWYSYCMSHGLQKHMGRPIGEIRQVASPGSGTINADGYRIRTIDGWRGFEHRWVMMQMLGRELSPEENVHHRNGVRSDNRPDNLELWSISQPSGQRILDKLTWAHQIIDLYGDLPEHLFIGYDCGTDDVRPAGLEPATPTLGKWRSIL
jgi:hypothetical protein